MRRPLDEAHGRRSRGGALRSRARLETGSSVLSERSLQTRIAPSRTAVTGQSLLSLARMAKALNYLDALDDVEGWLSPTTGLAMIETLWEQERRGARGDIAEIGVWHGKSFLALAAGARPGERLVAIDLFDAGDPTAQRPDLDVTPYGTGFRATFLANLAKFFPATQPEIIEASSASFANDQSALGALRLLSIDGGHSSEQTLNDLRLADACLTEEGVCWLDDIFNHSWPGVISGLFDYLNAAPQLQPVALFPNKLVLSRPDMAESWRTLFRALFDRALGRQGVELQRFIVDVYNEAWPHIAPALRASDIAVAEERALAAEAALSAYRESTSSLDAARRSAEERALAAEAELLACRESTSWRVTSPLRSMATAWRRFVVPQAPPD